MAVGAGTLRPPWRQASPCLPPWSPSLLPIVLREMSCPHAPHSVEHFIDVVVDGVKPIVTPQHGIDVMKVLDGVYKSARLGKEIRV